MKGLQLTSGNCIPISIWLHNQIVSRMVIVRCAIVLRSGKINCLSILDRHRLLVCGSMLTISMCFFAFIDQLL